nr:ethylene-responsive transcription factor RAP2-11-like [Ipomoea batatas]GME12443.1 ethylene-responsive transcription factor RAP2-11-like [Ipomoea batatas]
MDIHLEKRRKGEGNGAANTKRKFVEPETTETHPLIYSPVKAVKQVKDLGFGVVQAFKKRNSREFDTLETHPAIHSSPKTTPPRKRQILGDNNAYKPNFILGELGYDHHPQTPFLTDFDTFLVTQHQSSSSTYETRSLQIPELEQMKVERQICGGSVYATINGVNEYWENYSLSDAFLDLPMICQMFCPT